MIDSKDGSIVAPSMGGAPQQATTDGKGHVYIDVEDKGKIAVVDAKTFKVTSQFDLEGKGGPAPGWPWISRITFCFSTCRNRRTWSL